MDNVRVALIDFSPAETAGEAPNYKHSFCLGYKARDAAEDFLLARYRLFANVYFHKTTRGIEQLISALFRQIARAARENGRVAGLPEDHPLVKFFSAGGEEIANYRALDDTVVWGAFHSIAVSGEEQSKTLALNILNRIRPFCLDVQLEIPEDAEKQRRLKHLLDEKFKTKLDDSVFRDTARLTLYGKYKGNNGL
jgi:HD superfamily phosphohydrolase